MFNLNKKASNWSLAFALAAGIGATGNALPVLADDDEGLIEEVIVTGSRIRRDAGSHVGPMTILNGDAIGEIPNFNLGEALQELPSIGRQGLGKNDANGGRGANLVGIHQLGPARSLVLFNGKRTTSGIVGGTILGVDLQSFPVNMIERVEVLADGASAVYGSDAVAGVINIIPKKGFSGFSISAGAGSPSDEGGEHTDISLSTGISSDRGFFIAGLTYVDDGDVDFQQRSFSKIPLLGQLDTGSGVLNLVGSGIPPEGRITSGIPGALAGVFFKPDPATGLSYTPYDTFCGTTASGGDASGSIDCILNQGHRFNYNDIPSGVSLINGNQAVNFSAMGEYNFNDNLTFYLSAILAHREGTLNFTPLPVQGAAGRFTDLVQVPITNPNIPADFRDAVLAERRLAANCGPSDRDCILGDFQMSYRGLDFGPRTFDYDSDTISTTIGLKGTFEGLGVEGVAADWDWDVWTTFGRSELFEVTKGQLNVANLQIAVSPEACALVSSCPKNFLGQPTLDIFGRSAKTAEEIAFATFDDLERTSYDFVHWGANLSGTLTELPAGQVGFATGVEQRVESGDVQPSGIVGNGDSGGNFQEPTSGEYDVTELYAEVNIPLVSGSPGIEELSIDLAVRWSDYSTFGSESTYKAALSYAPTETIRFRGTYATGYRAPNVLELFSGKSDSFLTIGDPCSSATDANVLANCAADGVPAGFVQPAAQLKVSQGGNRALDTETSDTFTIGMVWQPEFANLRVAIDLYDIEIDDAIGTLAAGQVIGACYDSPNGSLSAVDCQRIGRGADGSVVRFDLLFENLDSIETSGIDLDTTYSIETDVGQVDVNWLVSYLDEYVETSSLGVVTDFTGVVEGSVGANNGFPEFKSTLKVTLAKDDWTASVQWRHLDEMEVSDVFGFDNINSTADAVNYIDLSGTYNYESFQFSAGVQNVLDEEPPYVTDASTNTSAVYDFYGTFYFARVNYSFDF